MAKKSMGSIPGAAFEGGISGLNAALAAARAGGSILADFQAECAQPERCAYCGSWSDRAVALVCPVCHWCGDVAVRVFHWGGVKPAGDARRELGLTDAEMR
jgi:hypothetical protein